MANTFVTADEKMQDFYKLTRHAFLETYSYLTEEEYDETAVAVGEYIKCPHCNFISDPCDFPDLYCTDTDRNQYTEQYELLMKMQKWGFNIVTCGHCGSVVLHETEVA